MILIVDLIYHLESYEFLKNFYALLNIYLIIFNN